MKFAITVYGNALDEIPTVVRRAEQLGFDGVWVGEHVVAPDDYATPHPYRNSGKPILPGDPRLYDVWTMIGVLIGVTTRIDIGTGVLIAPLRHPLLTARAAVSAHQLSNGRFLLGVGTGWMAEEYRALGVPFEERRARFEEQLEVFGKVFAGGPAEHEGPLYPFNARIQLTPTRVRIPLIFAGSTLPRAMRRAALHGDGMYNPSDLSVEECADMRREVDEIRRQAGLADTPFDWHVRVNDPPSAASVERLRRASFDRMIVPWNAIYPHTTGALADKLEALDAAAAALGLGARASEGLTRR